MATTREQDLETIEVVLPDAPTDVQEALATLMQQARAEAWDECVG